MSFAEISKDETSASNDVTFDLFRGMVLNNKNVKPDWYIFWSFMPETRINFNEIYQIMVLKKSNKLYNKKGCLDLDAVNGKYEEEGYDSLVFNYNPIENIKAVDRMIETTENAFHKHKTQIDGLINIIIQTMLDRFTRLGHMIQHNVYVMDFTRPNVVFNISEYIHEHSDVFELFSFLARSHKDYHFANHYALALFMKNTEE